MKVIDGSSFKSQLAERLASEAMIEFFRDEWPDLYNSTLKEYLYSQQNDISKFRTTAGLILA